MRVKKLFLFTVLILSTGFLFSQNFPEPPKPPRPGDDRPYKPYKGRRMEENDRKFAPSFIRVHADLENAVIEIFFTGPVDAASVNNNCIFIDGKPVLKDQIRFSKNGHGILFMVPAKDLIPEKYTLTVKNIKSVNGHIIDPVDFLNCGINCEYRYLERENQWRRF